MSEYISEVCQKYEIDFTRTDEISKLFGISFGLHYLCKRYGIFMRTFVN